MPSQVALRPPLTSAHPSSHEADWRQSVINELLQDEVSASLFEESLRSQNIEYERFESSLWVCYDRGGKRPDGSRVMSCWANFPVVDNLVLTQPTFPQPV